MHINAEFKPKDEIKTISPQVRLEIIHSPKSDEIYYYHNRSDV